LYNDTCWDYEQKLCTTVRKFSSDTADLGLSLPDTYVTLLVYTDLAVWLVEALR